VINAQPDRHFEPNPHLRSPELDAAKHGQYFLSLYGVEILNIDGKLVAVSHVWKINACNTVAGFSRVNDFLP
jgi:hypothetical protein